MVEQVKIICITCPKGCTLDVTRDGKTILNVEGAGCKHGAEYVDAETRDPRRMVATTVRVQGSRHPLLPVYTAQPFPKPRIRELLSVIRKVELKAPVKMGDLVLKNALGTGVDVIASRDMELRN
jgi:CxxC motif-containing protein